MFGKPCPRPDNFPDSEFQSSWIPNLHETSISALVILINRPDEWSLSFNLKRINFLWHSKTWFCWRLTHIYIFLLNLRPLAILVTSERLPLDRAVELDKTWQNCYLPQLFSVLRKKLIEISTFKNRSWGMQRSRNFFWRDDYRHGHSKLK